MKISLLHGDCMVRIAEIPDESIGALVCDPPYYLTAVSRGGSMRTAGTGPFGRHALATKAKGFMNREWDGDGLAHTTEFWIEIFRVIEPGGLIKAYAGTRTFHRLAMAVEGAGFEKCSLEAWNFGSGFPKSLAVARAIDRLIYNRREARIKEALREQGFTSVVWSNDRA